MRAISKVLAAGLTLSLAAAGAVILAEAASAGDSPGFYYGTDSSYVIVGGSPIYQEPATGGAYGGYIGMAGNWARTLGCKTGNFLDFSPTNSAQANANYTKYHAGIGTAVYWYMGGPGVDPHWNGTAAEASSRGATQAAWTLAAMKTVQVTYPVVWADIELPGIKPALDNGWNNWYTSPCSGVIKTAHVAASIDRAEFN